MWVNNWVSGENPLITLNNVLIDEKSDAHPIAKEIAFDNEVFVWLGKDRNRKAKVFD